MSVSEETTVDPAAGPEADLTVSKSDEVDPVTEGDDVTYTVSVTNNGPDTASNVVLTDNLPGGVSFISATPGQGSCSEAGGVVTCDLDDLVNGATVQVTIVVNAPTAGPLPNTARVPSYTGHPNSGNNTVSHNICPGNGSKCDN